MAGAIVTDTITVATANITNMIKFPSATVAAAGTNQATAAAIATGFTLVSASDGTKGVLLPAAAAGLICIVKNNVAAVLKVYPNTSDAINAIARPAAHGALDPD